MTEQPTTVTVVDAAARITWSGALAEDFATATDAVRRAVEVALESHGRVEAHVSANDEEAQRIATWSGMRREGIRRGVDGDLVVYARLKTDAPVHEPGGFRSLLNSFLPRKRAIGQLLIRDTAGRVLVCQLTYKQDWDLPGGVVEVGESPQLAVSREVEEELGLTLSAGSLVLTDWLPPWEGWDDALCLVFDGGVHDASLLERVVMQAREIKATEFLTLEEVYERCADFTARRVESALANLSPDTSERDSPGPAYTESGR